VGAASQPSAKARISRPLSDEHAVLATALDSRTGLPDRRKSSRNGTSRRAPPWNGLALSPAFAAQVLGQVLNSRRQSPRHATAAAVYRHQAMSLPAALLFDIKL